MFPSIVKSDTLLGLWTSKLEYAQGVIHYNSPPEPAMYEQTPERPQQMTDADRYAADVK